MCGEKAVRHECRVGGSRELCWVMEGYGEALSDPPPPAFVKCVFKGEPTLLGFKVTVSWVCTGSGAPAQKLTELPCLRRERTVLQMQESSKDAPSTSLKGWGWRVLCVCASRWRPPPLPLLPAADKLP